MIAPEYALALGGLLGSAAKAWVTTTQGTFSRRSVMDVIIGGVVGLLYPLYPIVELPKGSLVQAGAIMFVIAYFASDLIMNVAERIGLKLPDAGAPK